MGQNWSWEEIESERGGDVHITVEDRGALFCMNPVDTLLAIADEARFVVRQDKELVAEVKAVWHRRSEEWYARFPLEDLLPGVYEVRLEVPDCSKRPRGTLVVEG